MGTPIKLFIQGKAVYLCCEDCKASAQSDSAKTVATVEKLLKANHDELEGHDSHEHAAHKQEHKK